MILQRVMVAFALLGLLGLVAYDSRQHFDADLITLKRAHRSAQRDWNLFYGQNYVYNDSSIRYENDLSAMSSMVNQGAIALSDLATSYYLSAYSGLYVKRVHRHQGAPQSGDWFTLFKERTACYLHLEGNFEKLIAAITKLNRRSNKYKLPLFRYVVVNKDATNLNARYDCIWRGRHAMMEKLPSIANLVYEGTYLNLYEFNDRLVEIP